MSSGSERENKTQLYNSTNNNNRRNNTSNNKNKNNIRKNNSNNLGNKTISTQTKKKQSGYRKKGHDDNCNFIEHTAEWGDMCVQIKDSNEDTLQVYCQNVKGIFDPDGLGLDEAFHHMRTLKANVFTFNKTHGDDTNPEVRNVLR